MSGAIIAVTLAVTQVIAQNAPIPLTSKEAAEAIARTMNATRVTSASGIIKQSYAHDNVVESRTLFQDATAFAQLASHRDSVASGVTRYFCKDARRAYLKKGVVFHETYYGPDFARHFEFVIDERACASLIDPLPADAATLTENARVIAQRLSASLSNAQKILGLRFKAATSTGGVARVEYLITVPAFADFFKLKSNEIRGVTQGEVCAEFGDAIRQGVQVHVIYRLENEPPLFEFSVDKSIC